MKFITQKNVLVKGKVIPAGKSIDLDERSASTESLYKSGHILPKGEVQQQQPPQQPQQPPQPPPPKPNQ